MRSSRNKRPASKRKVSTASNHRAENKQDGFFEGRAEESELENDLEEGEGEEHVGEMVMAGDDDLNAGDMVAEMEFGGGPEELKRRAPGGNKRVRDLRWSVNRVELFEEHEVPAELDHTAMLSHGGENSWCRPPLPDIDSAKDTIGIFPTRCWIVCLRLCLCLCL